MPRLILLFALVALAASPEAQTCTTSWTAPVSGNWSIPSNWTAGVPGSGATACIQQPGTYTVNFDQERALGVLVLGGALGTQTLTLSETMASLGSGTVGPNGRLEVRGSANCALCDGLPRVTGTLTVEGVITHIGLTGLLSEGGTLDIAPGGQLLVDTSVTGINIGASNVFSTLRVRGRVVFDPGSDTPNLTTLHSRIDVDGGTFDVRAGSVRVNGGGRIGDTTFDIAADAEMRFTRGGPLVVYVADGTLTGEPQGSLVFTFTTLAAGPGGATLAVGGTGLQTETNAELGSTGGAFLNTGLFRVRNNGLFIRQVVLENAGTIRVEDQSVITPFEGAVLRNRAGAAVELLDGARILAGDGTGQFENAGLLHARVEAFTSLRVSSLGGRLRSQPGSELRIGNLTRLDLDLPASASFPAGTRVTGDGTLRISSTQFFIEGEVSPGTEVQPIAALGASGRFYFSPTAGDPRLLIDVDADGQSDRIDFIGTGGPVFPIRPAGTLVVRVRPGYTPQIGDTFTILEGTNVNQIQGEFAQVVAEGALAGITFVAEYSNANPSTITVRAIEAAPTATEDEAGGALLLAPHPNPAHGAVVLRCRLPSSGAVDLRVFDALGREVAVVLEGERSAGDLEVAFDAGRLSPGIYVVVLEAGDAVMTRTLTVVR
ncbi:T9SS type A sorting domain-containing protein [Rubrivirga sp.]|uniref:T9SS type A sorting domain-containing protein n=1 Tax=Rubrivirga sp. TaxID=1885344 RepID=UPI003C7138BD